MRRSPQVRQLIFRLPPYDTPCALDHNNPQFHVNRTNAAGGVFEQRQMALQKYIYRFIIIGMWIFKLHTSTV